jgi:phenylalanyl-tRNA synthetase alpha chain
MDEDMIDDIRKILDQAHADLRAAADEDAVRAVEVRAMGKKGELTSLLKTMGRLAAEDRPRFGAAVNEARALIEGAIAKRRQDIERERIEASLATDMLDVSMPGAPACTGTFHPITLVASHIEEVFRSMGFLVLDYPEAESDFFNFEALNIPRDHPARDMQDTFYLSDGNLLRTHTSAGQVRAMREYEPPLRAIFPGRVFRYEEVDASHEHTFHQVEGLMVDEDISVGHLLSSMKTLLRAIFDRDVTVRLRPGYFPFVEPGFELDIRCMVCGGPGCPVCKQSGWVELLPCGLVHPNVLGFGGLDPTRWSGWAFGLGLSRLVMMKYRIDDIRLLLQNDLRFLRQFGGRP